MLHCEASREKRGLEEETMNFETRLYELRKKAGLSQEELANLVGVSRQAVQKWEAGTSRPDVDNLTALASYFNVTLDWLILGREPELLQERPVVVENHYHYEGWHYEYKSERTLFGLPLVHVNLSQRGLTWARGIVAIGNVATGVVAIGCFAAGILSLGAICLGLLVLAGMAVGLVALGGISIGIIAVGGCALGYLAIGGSAVGVYAGGGAAVASRVAVGTSASGELLAVGREAAGAVTLGLEASRETVTQAMVQAGVPGWIQGILLFCLGK